MGGVDDDLEPGEIAEEVPVIDAAEERRKRRKSRWEDQDEPAPQQSGADSAEAPAEGGRRKKSRWGPQDTAVVAIAVCPLASL